MSTIDRRIVEMKFDNGDFGKKTEQTVKNLQELEKALKLDNAGKGLAGIEEQAKHFSLDNISKNVENVSSKFSVMGAIGLSAIQNLTNAAINFGKSKIGDLLDPIIGGGKRRSTNISNAKFQLEGLGVAWGDVSEHISYAVNETAYGLDEAAKAAAQFVASSVPMEKMGSSLRAISGVAAMTNSTYDDTASIFTKVAGQGRLMGDDLNRMAVRGLNAAATLGTALGKSEEDVRKMVTEGQISFQMFADAMDGAFGDHAKKANETYSGSLSNMRASLARIGEMFATPNFTRLRDIFNGLTPVFNAVKVALTPLATSVENMMKINVMVLTSGFSSLVGPIEKSTESVRIFGAILENLEWLSRSIMDPIIAAFKDVFQVSEDAHTSVEDFLNSVYAFTLGLILNQEQTDNLRNAFKAFFDTVKKVFGAVRSVLGLLWDVVKGVAGVFFDLGSAMGAPAGIFVAIVGLVADVVKNFVDMIRTSGAVKTFFTVLRKIMEPVILIFQRLIEVIKLVWQVLKDAGIISFVGGLFEKLGDIVVAVFTWIADAITPWIEKLKEMTVDTEKVQEVTGKFIDFFTNGWQGLMDFLEPIFAGIKEFFRTLPGNITASEGGFNGFIGTVQGWATGIWTTLKNLQSPVGEFFNNIATWASGVWSKASPHLQEFWRQLTEFFGGVASGVKEALDGLTKEDVMGIINYGVIGAGLVSIFKMMKSFRTLLDSMSGFNDALKGMLGSIGGAFTAFGDYFTALKNSMKYDALIKIGIAIALIAGSLWLLSTIETGKLWNSVAVLGAIAVIMIVLSASFTRLNKSMGKDFKSGALIVGLQGMAVAILVLALAVQKLAVLDPAAMWSAVAAISVLIIVLGAFALVLSKFEGLKTGNVLKAAIGLAAMAGVMYLMAQVLQLYMGMDVELFTTGMMRLTVVLAVLSVAAYVLGQSSGNAIKGAIAMLLMVAVLRAMYEVVVMFAAMDLELMSQGLWLTAIALGALVVAAVALGMFGEKAIAGAMAMMIVAAALVVMAQAVVMLSSIDLQTLAITMGLLVGMMAAMVASVFLLQTAAPGAFAMITIATAMLILAAAVWILAQVPAEQLKQAATVMVLAIFAMTVALMALAPLTPVAIGFGAAVLMIGAGAVLAAIGMMMFPLAAGPVGDAIVSLGQKIAVLGPLMFDLIAAGIGLVALGIGLAVVGVAFGLIGAGVFLLALGLASLAVTGPAGTMALKLFFEMLLDFGVIAMAKLAGWAITLGVFGAAMFVLGVGTALAAIGLALFAIGFALAAAAIILLADPTTKALQRMAEAIPPTLDLMAAALENSVPRIMNAIIEIQNAFRMMAIMVVQAIITATTAATDAGTRLGNAVAVGVLKAGPLVQSSGKAIITGFISVLNSQANTTTPVGTLYITNFTKGMTAGSTQVVSATRQIGQTVIITLTELAMQTNSAGKFAITSYVSGITSMATTLQGSVRSSGHGLGTSMTTGMQNGLNAGAPAVYAVARRIANTAAQTIRDALKIKSPSRIMFGIGQMMTEGQRLGMLDGEKEFVRSAKNMSDSITDAMSLSYGNQNGSIFEDVSPTITPVLDLSSVIQGARGIESLFNGLDQSVSIGANRAASLGHMLSEQPYSSSGVASNTTNLTYQQTINSPKVVSNAELYRKTRTLLAVKKKETEAY